MKRLYKSTNWFKIIVAMLVYCAVALILLPLVLKALFLIPALKQISGMFSFQFEAIANDVISSQITLSFLIITVLSVLSENSVLLLWENRIEEALIRPIMGSFLDFTVYSFGTIICSFIFYVRKDVKALLYFFVLNITVLTILTFKMLLVYYGRGVRISVLEKKYETMSEEKQKEVRKDLLVNTIKAMEVKDLRAAKENISFYNKIIKAKEELLESELEFFSGLSVSEDNFLRILSEELIGVIRIYYAEKLENLKKEYENESLWFEAPTETYIKIDEIYEKALLNNRELIKNIFKDCPWFEWNMTPEFAKQTRLLGLWICSKEKEYEKIDDKLIKIVPDFNPEDFLDAAREGYWSNIEKIIYKKCDLGYFFKSVVACIVYGKELMCRNPHKRDEKITFFQAFFGDIKEDGTVSKTVGYFNSICRRFEIYMKKNTKSFSEEERKEYEARLNDLESQLKNSYYGNNRNEMHYQIFEKWLKEIREILTGKKIS